MGRRNKSYSKDLHQQAYECFIKNAGFLAKAKKML